MNIKPKHLSLIFAIVTIFLVAFRLFYKDFDDKYYQSLILFLLGTMITLMWYINNSQDKLVRNFAEEEKKRDINEEKRQKATFKMLERLTSAIVEVFPGNEYPKKYYEFKISTAQEKVEDLTWAVFDREGKLDATTPSYLNKIQAVADGGINYDEIFIFHKNNLNHIERLKKLKFHYEIAKKSKRVKSKYSCSYFDTKELKFDFPRIQFTLVDNDEIIFTSSSNGNEKFKIKNKQLAKLFKSYYDEAWKLSTILINNGKIVNEDKILQLLESIND